MLLWCLDVGAWCFRLRLSHLSLPGYARSMTRSRSLCLATFVLLALAGAGCSSFNREWRKAAKNPAPTDSISGRWDGHWISDVNHHTGRLRCIVTSKGNDLLQARFHATYQSIFTFGYTVDLHTVQTNGTVSFDGEANLGSFAGGLYKYEGQAQATNFFSTYSCKYDHGIFQMYRPPPAIDH